MQFKGIININLFAPVSLYLTGYAKDMVQSYEDQQRHLKSREVLNFFDAKVVNEQFKKAYLPMFPLVPEHLSKEEVPQLKK